MARRLVSHVHVLNPKTGVHEVFGPADELPAWVSKEVGEHCFTDDAPAPVEESSDSEAK